jgi:hypothetical protein
MSVMDQDGALAGGIARLEANRQPPWVMSWLWQAASNVSLMRLPCATMMGVSDV